MRYLILGLALTFCVSCSALEKLEQSAEKLSFSLDKADQVLDGTIESSAKIKQAIAGADLNNDGRVSGLSEIWQLLIGLAGVFGIGGTAVAMRANAKVKDVERASQAK